MDRYCEYCVNLRSVVYCKADAAYLCLPCDTKVHSANPLSKRHHRTLICDTCRRRPSYVRCYDHQKFMCRSCDLNQHNNDAPNSQHRRRVINSYMGSPSAQELGVLWGCDSNRLLDDTKNSGTAPPTKEIYGGMKACSVLQQLVELLRVQTIELDSSISSVIRCQEHQVENAPPDQLLLGGECLDDQQADMISLDSSCLSSFVQLDHLEFETDETDLPPGDSFWQCNSSVLSGQLWSQNMQDLGVCEEPSCFDDVNMPDIDLTFRNFEELFRIEQEPTSIDQDTSMATTSISKTESCTKKARRASPVVMFFSQSRGQSNGTVSIGSSISPSSGSMEHQEPLKLKEKNNVQTKDPKQGQSGLKKARSDPRKRSIKSQIWRFESHEPVTRSF
uniref:putative zinc finger protein At1g68190 n=1 Tax=Erigeron canadensis TaxID=72917 RepID=UPI001CB8D68E|nr:putative zinc finger protein At1g68190 [Erigeron canadensis]